jgi:Na+-translocating ferredoxin:NAD+ oxidoreductase RnfD subunit
MTEPVAAPRPVLAGSVPRGGIGVNGFYLAHFLGAVFPATAGAMLYGWRATVVLAVVMLCAMASTYVWRRVGPRGRTLHYAHTLWLALLLALMLPAHLAATGADGVADHVNVWALLPLAALLMVMIAWLFGGLGGWHLHPALATYMLLAICFSDLLVPRRILNRDHILLGELFGTVHAESGRTAPNDPWIGRRHNAADADLREPAAERLSRYTRGREVPARQWLPLPALLRDAMPPLEDFIVAGQPGGLGTSSAIGLIIGGLFLLYRGVIDYRIPLLTCGAAYLAMLILPVPTIISDAPQWHWAVMRMPDIGWSVAITFANYEVMASPLLFVAFFLATAPMLRPMTRRGRTIYALFLGIACSTFQLYVSVSLGPYLALLIASVLTPELDRWFGVRPLA